MLVDIHAHYPMHVLPSKRQRAHERLVQWRKERWRARVVRWLSRDFNFQGPADGPGVTLELMRAGDVGVILSVLYSPFDEIDLGRRYGDPPSPAYFPRLLDQLTAVEDDIAEQRSRGARASIAHAPAELERALAAGEKVLVHAVEGGFHLGDRESEVRDNVRTLAEKGVAYITVAHLFWRRFSTNAPALPFMPDWLYNAVFRQPRQEGLSALGRAAVHAMVDHGVFVDVTHMSERAIGETLDLLDERDPERHVPVLATHMACRLGSLQYNLPEWAIRRIAERKGLLGLIACQHYISDGKPAPGRFEDSFDLLCKHIDQIREWTGSDECIAFGTDIDGYIKPALKGLENLGDMRALQEALVDRYGPDRAERFASGNALRVLRSAWQAPSKSPPRPAAGSPSSVAAPSAAADPAPPAGPGPRDALAIAGFLLGLVGYLLLVGWLVDWVRLAAARLPAPLTADAFGAARLLGDGLRSATLAGAVLALLCVVAYVASALHWDRNGPRWHALVRERGVGPARRHGASARESANRTSGAYGQAPLGEGAVRVLAGFNTVVLASLLALVPARAIDALLPAAWWGIVLVWSAAFLAAYLLLARWGPLRWHERVHGIVWALVVAAAVFASAPFGLLVLASVLVATFGRVIARLARPHSIAQWVRSPLPWALLAVVTLIALGYQAMPPVTFPSAVLATAAGQRTGGYVARSGAGVYLASCASRSDATSTGERLSLVPSGQVKALTVVSRAYRFDSGQRPSLATLALHAVGVEGAAPVLLDADLRAMGETCGGEGTGIVSNFPALGTGVLVGPGPPGGRAADGEAPIQDTSFAPIAALARRYQPTVEVTIADRFWPVSVGAVLAERGSAGERTCLVQRREPRSLCAPPSLASLAGVGADPRDYLQLPARLARESRPDRQFAAFMRGRAIEPGPPSRWLADPSLLDPWTTAQVYFYLARRIETGQWPRKARNPLVPSGLLGLEYWFYYPYNYYPAVVRAKLMQATPLAGDRLHVDLHQGDWEHIDVLLDQRTLKPVWLYMARHSFEGQFVPWSSVTLDDGHPVVQAAFGGHPTYLPGCGAQPRAVARNLLSDWLVCGSGRFAFRATSTPLVDLATTTWGCWPGHFGEAATAPELANATKPETVLDRLRRSRFVAGPLSPLQQAENKGTCKRDPRTDELAVLPRVRAAGTP